MPNIWYKYYISFILIQNYKSIKSLKRYCLKILYKMLLMSTVTVTQVILRAYQIWTGFSLALQLYHSDGIHFY